MIAMEILLQIGIAAIISGMIAVGMNRLFPKRGNWLPVMVATFVPPLLYVPYSIYRLLVQVGLSAETGEGPGSAPIDYLAVSITALVVFTVTWLIVAVPASFIALHVFRRK